MITAIREVRAKHNVQPKRRPTLYVPKARFPHTPWTNETLVSTLAGWAPSRTKRLRLPFVDFYERGAEQLLSDMADAVDAGAEKCADQAGR